MGDSQSRASGRGAEVGCIRPLTESIAARGERQKPPQSWNQYPIASQQAQPPDRKVCTAELLDRDRSKSANTVHPMAIMIVDVHLSVPASAAWIMVRALSNPHYKWILAGNSPSSHQRIAYTNNNPSMLVRDNCRTNA